MASASEIAIVGYVVVKGMSVLRGYLLRERADVLFASGNTYGIVAVAMKLLLGRRCPPVAIKIGWRAVQGIEDAASAFLGRLGLAFHRFERT